MTVIEYRNWGDIDIRFNNGYVARNKQYNQFKKGTIKNPYDLSVYGVGFLGEGEYKVKNNGKVNKNYRVWHSMLERCYYTKIHETFPTYKDCSVSQEWHNFQIFSLWFDENYYEIDEERMELDKDILIKNNKIYSPDTCIFVPNSINKFFVRKERCRGEYPIGVSHVKSKNKFVAQCSDGTKRKKIGYYDNAYQAFLAYKNYKENVAKILAEKFKYKIPSKLYDILINFKVCIDD